MTLRNLTLSGMKQLPSEGIEQLRRARLEPVIEAD